MMATLVSGCVWKRLFSFLVLDSVFFAMGARNGMFCVPILHSTVRSRSTLFNRAVY